MNYQRLLLLLLCIPVYTWSQTYDDTKICELIQIYKEDPRGPYKDIRWFCPNDSINMPRVPCKDPGGNQRARYKDRVEDMANERHVFLGQILATTKNSDFWDARNDHSRLKQYQLGKYLAAIDDGWVNHSGQYYRGAFQIEDEREWGLEFLQWALRSPSTVIENFFLLRQAAKTLPHNEENDRSVNVRAVSQTIADKYPEFQNIRIKIHGQPDRTDIGKVKEFQKEHAKKITFPLKQDFEVLIKDMEEMYQPKNLETLRNYIDDLPSRSEIIAHLDQYIDFHANSSNDPSRLTATAEVLYAIREAMPKVNTRRGRLALLDISNALEQIYFTEIAQWETKNTADLMDKVCYTALAAAGAGFIEQWEWKSIEGRLSVPIEAFITLKDLTNFLETSRGIVEWGTGTVNAVYGEVVDLYYGFEPLSKDFIDDVIRGSVLLRLGQTVSDLGDKVANEAGLSNHLFSLSDQSSARGLNPGYAKGELVVLDHATEDMAVDNNKIYVFRRPPSDLKPVAGIATVTEGNMVSHVQLLARNLGIPNAVISNENLQNLQRYAGEEVFYAVSNQGTVIMKPIDKMTEIEKGLFSEQIRNENKVTVPVEKIDLSVNKVLNMRQVDAKSSGVVCGPKAANLGQLKELFPKQVVEGLVIPFGIFRAHMNQAMKGQNQSYWEYLNASFAQANKMTESGSPTAAVERFTLERLSILRAAIKNINLSPEFVAQLQQGFVDAFGNRLGNVPVFLRSDTNMEDLKEFTGAGLNLTKFNVVDNQKIIDGIKEVWASPYTERSFKWRQRYLLNPENVFPSILIIPTVDVAYSGVVITKGITTRDGRDVTIAFSRGAGGAVDGQAAETYLLRHDQENILLSPAREPDYRRLPTTGGSVMNKTTFEAPILSTENLYDLRVLAYNIHQKFPKSEASNSHGPFDIELGFKDDQMWLFQVRPFVENKRAKSSTYLESISPKVPEDKRVSLF